MTRPTTGSSSQGSVPGARPVPDGAQQPSGALCAKNNTWTTPMGVLVTVLTGVSLSSSWRVVVGKNTNNTKGLVLSASAAAVATVAAVTTWLAAKLRRLERQRTRARLDDASLANANHRSLLAAAGSPVVVAGADMIVRDANEATSVVFGYTREELLGQNVKVLMPERDSDDASVPSTRAAHASYVKRYLETGEKRIIGVSKGRKVTGRHKSGALLDLVLNIAEAPMPDGSGRPYFAAIFQDITELCARRDASSTLARSQATLLRSLGVPCVAVDRVNTVLDANDAAKDLFGFETLDDLIGKRVGDVLGANSEAQRGKEEEEADPRGKDEADQVATTTTTTQGQKRSSVMVARRADTGAPLKISVRELARTCDASGAEQFLVLLDDVSEWHSRLASQTHEVEVQKKALSQFSHEMRGKYAPGVEVLETIQSLVRDEGLLSVEHSENHNASRNLGAALRDMRGDIRLAVALLREADELVRTRLELHKVYRGQYVSEANVETIELRAAMWRRVEAARAVAHQGHYCGGGDYYANNVTPEDTDPLAVNFRADLGPDIADGIDVFVRVDAYVFDHVARNLLSNAAKHTASGEVVLRFLGVVATKKKSQNSLAATTTTSTTSPTTQQQQQQQQLLFCVCDTGGGIPTDIANRLFTEEVATADVRSSGLGLLSCRAFAHAVGGDVWLDATKLWTVDDPTSWSRFKFSLPGHVVETRPAEGPPTPSTLARPLFVAAGASDVCGVPGRALAGDVPGIVSPDVDSLGGRGVVRSPPLSALATSRGVLPPPETTTRRAPPRTTSSETTAVPPLEKRAALGAAAGAPVEENAVDGSALRNVRTPSAADGVLADEALSSSSEAAAAASPTAAAATTRRPPTDPLAFRQRVASPSSSARSPSAQSQQQPLAAPGTETTRDADANVAPPDNPEKHHHGGVSYNVDPNRDRSLSAASSGGESDDDAALNTKGCGPQEDAALAELDVYVCEDSSVIRRSMIGKLKAVRRRVQAASGTSWTYHEHATVESLLPRIATFVDRPNVVVTVDHNLDSQGGKLRGTDLIKALASSRFRGIIASASGDDASAAEHVAAGAHVVWGKPLPPAERLLETLRAAARAQLRLASRASDSSSSSSPSSSNDSSAAATTETTEETPTEDARLGTEQRGRTLGLRPAL